MDLIEKVRNEALVREEDYKRETTKYYNKWLKNRQFQKGDLALRWAEISDYVLRKLDLVYEGPFRVAMITRPSSYWLEELDGKPFPYSWNISNLRKFHS